MTDLNEVRGDDRAIDDCAARWATKRISGDFNKSDELKLREWLNEDPHHARAFEEYLAIAEAGALAGAVSGMQEPANDQTAPVIAAPRRAWLIGAPAVAASLFAAFFMLAPMQEAPSQGERFATSKGETRDFPLPDGSVVTLNTDSALTFSIENGERHAALERGEAFFDVKRDETRPFVVDAGGARATVLGTTFTVRKKPDEAVIHVLSGVVAVRASTDTPNAAGVRLEHGQQVTVASTGSLSGVDRFDPGIVATWRHGYLYFDNTPLKRVVDDLNRYFEPQIELEDDALGDAPVSGRIELDNQDVAIRAISVALSLNTDRSDSGKIIFRADE